MGEDYQVLNIKEDCINVVGCLKDLIEDFEIVFFGSNKKIESLEIKVEDFEEENIILTIKPEINNSKITCNSITIVGKSIKYSVLGFMLGFKFDGKKYYAILSEMWVANSDNRCFTINSSAFEKFNFLDLFELK